jgi:hypothetical protein
MGTSSDFGAYTESYTEQLFRVTGAHWPYWLALVVTLGGVL